MRFLRQLIAKATWPMLRHQAAFNHTVLQDSAMLSQLLGELQQSIGHHTDSLAHHTEVLVRFESTLADHGALLATVPNLSDALRELQLKVALIEQAMSDLTLNLRNEVLAETGRSRELLETHSEISERALAELQMRIAELDLYFAELRGSVDRQDAPLSTPAVPTPPRAFDGIYAALENAFRGGPNLVKERLQVYLPRVLAATIDNGLVLDLGCGRGEWLEMLRDAGIRAQGVDSNVTYSDSWEAAGLGVTTGDVIEYLRSLRPGSTAVVTGFHIVEHLPLDVLIELLDLANRALREGGLLILETPNPENLIVGASSFYLDPTHQRPLPPPLLEFLVGARGFVSASVTRLQREVPDVLPTVTGESGPWRHDLAPLIELINNQLYGPQDYAVTAYHV